MLIHTQLFQFLINTRLKEVPKTRLLVTYISREVFKAVGLPSELTFLKSN